MGAFAVAVQERLRDALDASDRSRRWVTEHRVAGTPVDVAGLDHPRIVLVELEWRRADPADNAAKLFRHLHEGAFEESEAEEPMSPAEIVVCQVFTRYYDLASGGVSSKRKNAEFVGRVAARTHDRFAYHPIEFDLDPPKRGADWPEGWRATADDVGREITERV